MTDSHQPDRSTNRATVARLTGVTLAYGELLALDNVSIDLPSGAMVGLIGPDGVGKSSLLSLVAGARKIQQGNVEVLGGDMADPNHRRNSYSRIAYMPQGLGKNLYPTLSVFENVEFFGRLFGQGRAEREYRIAELLAATGMSPFVDRPAGKLSGGMKQKLSLCGALIHDPDLLILDEPTSGVDPVARDAFWQILIDLSRRDGVTIFISTHFMNEAERCDRISLMHAGHVLVSDSPAKIVERRGARSLEEAFIQYLEDAAAEPQAADTSSESSFTALAEPSRTERPREATFSLRRMMSYTRREALELRRDPVRLTLAVAGSLILMIIMGFGINMDIEDLKFAVLDRDQTTASRDYILNLAGSRYFIEQPPLTDYVDLDRRMRSGDLALAIEIPSGFGRDIARGRPVQVGAWVDGAMPSRGEVIRSYVQGMHTQWLLDAARRKTGLRNLKGPATIELRFRYNQNVDSLPAMVPAVIPLMLLIIPTMLAALSVVREKELGSIINFYVTPITRLEFLLGKQVPYVALGFLNFVLMTVLAVYGFGVPVTGSLFALSLAALLYVISTTAMGLLISTFMRSQIAAMAGTAILTLTPAAQFSGMIDPVTSLEGLGAFLGRIYPTTHFLTIARGTFSKGLHFADLIGSFIPLVTSIPVLIGAAVLLLKKQET